MRTDVALLLIGMGFVPDVDFVATQVSPSSVDVQWLSQQPQPTESEIDDFALANPDAYQLAVTAQAQRAIGSFHVLRKAADQSTTSNVFADVTGLNSFQLTPNTHYRFRFVGMYTSSAGTVGLQLSVNGPASPAFIRFLGTIATSTNATIYGGGAAYDAAVAATASGGGSALPFWLEGTISTGAIGGTFGLRFRSETNGSAVTILRGCFAELAAVA